MNFNVFQQFLKQPFFGILIGLLLAVAFSLLAFTEPTQAPPLNNVAAPINASSAVQDKIGWLTFEGGGTRGDTYLATLSGNVGIGTVSPNAKVTINGGDLFMATAGTGFILKETDGPNCKKFTVNSAGALNLFTVDCATGAGCLTGYQDTDTDTYTVGNGQSFCGVASLPAGFRSTQSASPDCNDANIALWQNLTGYLDNDSDGYGAGSAQTVCSGSSLPAGYVTNNQDCYDASSNARPGQTSCFTSNRGDGSFDYDCDGSSSAASPCQQFYPGNEPGGYCNIPGACGTGGQSQCDYGFGNACCGSWQTTSCR